MASFWNLSRCWQKLDRRILTQEFFSRLLSGILLYVLASGLLVYTLLFFAGVLNSLVHFHVCF